MKQTMKVPFLPKFNIDEPPINIRSDFNALTIGRSLVAAVLLCIKRGRHLFQSTHTEPQKIIVVGLNWPFG